MNFRSNVFMILLGYGIIYTNLNPEKTYALNLFLFFLLFFIYNIFSLTELGLQHPDKNRNKHRLYLS